MISALYLSWDIQNFSLEFAKQLRIWNETFKPQEFTDGWKQEMHLPWCQAGFEQVMLMLMCVDH